MHAVFITFSTTEAPESLLEAFDAYARALADVPGLIAKTWIADGATLGGFHVFDDAEVADRFLAGDLFGSIQSDVRFHAFEVRRFDVMEELTAMTGGSRPASRS